METRLKEKYILKSVISANEKYLNNILNQIEDEKKDFVNKMFLKHMTEIKDFCLETMNNNEILTENFIKNLHKIHFPEWYQKTKEINWKKIVTSIPWVYRSNENYMWVMAKDVKSEMKDLIEKNKNIKSFDEIFLFLLNLFKIHPFWDWNWRIFSILTDLLLIQNNLKPYFFKKKVDDKIIEKNIFYSIIKSLKEKKWDFFLLEIKKYI